MMNRFKIIIIGVLITVLFYSCNSPLDVDTPRKKEGNGTVKRITPTPTQLSLEANGNNIDFQTKQIFIELDTSTNPPSIWIHFVTEPKAGENLYTDRLKIAGFDIQCDSCLVNGNPLQLKNINATPPFAKFKLARGIDSRFDTMAVAGEGRNFSEMSFTLNQKEKKVWSYLYAKVYDYRYWHESRDTIVIDSITKKEVKITIEEDKRALDSLFLRGKFLFEY